MLCLCQGLLFECVGALLVRGHSMRTCHLLLLGGTQVSSRQDSVPVQDQKSYTTGVREGKISQVLWKDRDTILIISSLAQASPAADYSTCAQEIASSCGW